MVKVIVYIPKYINILKKPFTGCKRLFLFWGKKDYFRKNKLV